MYEEGMNLDNMKELIKVLQESKEMHENVSKKSNVKKKKLEFYFP